MSIEAKKRSKLSVYKYFLLKPPFATKNTKRDVDIRIVLKIITICAI